MAAALAVTVAVALGISLRARAAALVAARDEARSLRDELDALRRRIAKKSGSDEKRTNDMNELRRRLDKAKKRAAQAREEQKAGAERIRELEHDIDLRLAELRAARAELSRSEATETPRPRPVAAPAPPAPEPPPAPREVETTPAGSDDTTAKLAARVESLEGELAQRTDELAKATLEITRARAKAETQNKLYMAMRGELEAKKDRLRQQREDIERLQALRVAVAGVEEPSPEA